MKNLQGFILIVFTLAGSPTAWPISNTADPGIWGAEGGIVYGVVRAGDVVYLGGDFTSLVSPDGSISVPVSGLAALNVHSGEPTGWQPSTDGIVYALEAAADGSAIYVGGTFTTIDGVACPRFAAIAPDGSLLWSGNAASTVRAILVSGNTIYVGGNFTKILGATRVRLAAIQPPAPGGSAPTLLSWAPSIMATNGTSASVQGLASANGDVVAVGNFTTANGQASVNQARFDAVTGTLKSWASHISTAPKDVTTDGVNYYGAFGGGGGRVVAWGPSGQQLWVAAGNGDMQAITCCDGQVIVGGHFTTILGADIIRLAALWPDGTLDTSFNPSPNSGGDLGVWAVYCGGAKLHIGGGFGQVGGMRARGYAQFAVEQPDTGPPTAPQNLTATAAGSNRVDLRWRASTDDIGVTGYQIRRNQQFLANTGAVTSYSDTRVAPLTSYTYVVSARDAAGKVSGPSNQATVTTPADTVPPSTPSGLVALGATASQIDLRWDASTDNVGVTGYDVFRDDRFLASLGTTTSYSDRGLSGKSFYEYQVRARDARNNVSPLSAVVKARTRPH